MMGRQIDKITLRGFKSIKDLQDFPLKSLNILIGANGAGKSNFVISSRFFVRLWQAVLERSSLKQGGADVLFFMGPKVHPAAYRRAFNLASVSTIRSGRHDRSLV